MEHPIVVIATEHELPALRIDNRIVAIHPGWLTLVINEEEITDGD